MPKKRQRDFKLSPEQQVFTQGNIRPVQVVVKMIR